MYLFTRCFPSISHPGFAKDGAPCRKDRRVPHHAANISTLVGDHACNLLLICLIQNRISIELALALSRLRSQDVALERVTALDFATACLVEALRRSAMCLKL